MSSQPVLAMYFEAAMTGAGSLSMPGRLKDIEGQEDPSMLKRVVHDVQKVVQRKEETANSTDSMEGVVWCFVVVSQEVS